MRTKRAIVVGLELACGLIDDIPGIWVSEGRIRFVRHAQYGCWPLRLAQRSADLDDRWGTKAWSRQDHD